jgi:hypothetical protein
MSNWHVHDGDLRAWVEGRAPLTTAVSIEQHVERCPQCQDSVAVMSRTRVALLDVEGSWAAIRDEIEPQPMPWLGRQLRRLGVSEASSWVTSSAPALTGAWVTAVTVVLGMVLAAGLWAGKPGEALFLALAPILPMLGVASAYGSEVDPTYELTIAAPFSKLRILLLRTATVVVVCVPLSTVAGIAMEGPWWVAVAWLLPAAAFLMVTLASATFVPPHYAAIVTGLGWVTVALGVARVGEPSDLFTATATMTYAIVAGTAAVVFVARFRHLSTHGRMG